MKSCSQLLRLIYDVRQRYPVSCPLERCVKIFLYVRKIIKVLKYENSDYTKRYFLHAINFIFEEKTKTSKILRKIFLINFALLKARKNCRRKQIKENKYFCHVCRKYFIRKFHFLQHLRMHYNLLMYKCDKCDSTFAQQNGLNYHRSMKECEKIKRRPTEVVVYEYCETCRKFYRQGSNLRNHILRTHATNDLFLGLNKDQQFQLVKCNFILFYYIDPRTRYKIYRNS